MEILNKSTLSFRRTPESSQIKPLDPGVRRGDDLFGSSLWAKAHARSYAASLRASQ
jgi:hypothetical protein